MDAVSEALEREIAACDYEVAKLRFLAAPTDEVRRAEMRAAHRATRFSKAYRSGDLPRTRTPTTAQRRRRPESVEQALLTPIDLLTLLVWRWCTRPWPKPQAAAAAARE